MLPSRFWTIAMCPHCRGSLQKESDRAHCVSCDRTYDRNRHEQFDFRLQGRVNKSADYDIVSTSQPTSDSDVFTQFQQHSDPAIDIDSLEVSGRNRKQLSYLPAPDDGAVAVEAGTISATLRPALERIGYEYVGFDVTSVEAPFLADGRAIPIQDDSVDVVVSNRVIEHVRYPILFFNEIRRILKPGGMFVGSVGFLEPWHGFSNCHLSHHGTYNMLQAAEFDIRWIAPDTHGLFKISQMGLFLKLNKHLSTALAVPLYALHLLWYKIGFYYTGSEAASDLQRRLRNAGGFTFLANVP